MYLCEHNHYQIGFFYYVTPHCGVGTGSTQKVHIISHKKVEVYIFNTKILKANLFHKFSMKINNKFTYTSKMPWMDKCTVNNYLKFFLEILLLWWYFLEWVGNQVVSSHWKFNLALYRVGLQTQPEQDNKDFTLFFVNQSLISVHL